MAKAKKMALALARSGPRNLLRNAERLLAGPQRAEATRDDKGAGFFKYLENASSCSLDNLELARLSQAADDKRAVIEALIQWVESLAEAKYVEWVRKFHGARAQAALADSSRARTVTVETENASEPGPDENGGPPIPDPLDDPFGSWFNSHAHAGRVRTFRSNRWRERWIRHYAKWGCINCKDKTLRPHFSNGFCVNCFQSIVGRLKRIDAKLEVERDE